MDLRACEREDRTKISLLFFASSLAHVLAASRRGIQKRAVLTARFFTRVIATLLYAFARSDWQPYPVPREMTAGEIKNCVKQFRQGALNSIEAGFDGVEVRNQMVIWVQRKI